jgi:hypothetical protein
MAIMGGTVKIRAEFKNFEGTYQDPTEIKFVAYSKDKNILSEDDVTVDHKISAGIYEYPFTIPVLKTDSTEIICELSGNVSGYQVVVRKKIQVQFSN